MRRLGEILAQTNSRVIIIGDRKGPARFDLASADLFTLEQQAALPHLLAEKLPTGHYSRKNLGYLEAMRRRAACIYETDDDNMPADNWRPRTLATPARPWVHDGWVNTYRCFTEQLIWPRGFPLRLINDPATFQSKDWPPAQTLESPIQQGLADVAPDVDAVWRLALDREFYFQPGPSLWLAPGAWCPFNSQSTWWWPAAYPLLYLPSYCTFRMTDIWRSFIAQRCLWELGQGVVFHAAEVVQQRNAHDFLRDFEDEIPGYLNNEKIADCLTRLKLRPGLGAVTDNLTTCYEGLVQAGFLPADELTLVKAWLKDLGNVKH
jgi:hypothetical protein